jgi:hypothetical protein
LLFVISSLVALCISTKTFIHAYNYFSGVKNILKW